MSLVRLFAVCILAIMSIGFLYKFFTGSNNEIQIAKVFWHESRLLHGGLYLISAYYLYRNNVRMMTVALLIDVFGSLLYRLLSQQ